jgi:cytochrome P450
VKIFGFIVAGHDTTSTTLMWSIKLFAEYPQAQAKLREALQGAFSQARLESRLPTNAEIQEATNIPYLDAVIEELLRCSPTLPINLRDTVRDTVILGHHIPKGTMVFLHQAAHGIVMPPFPIDESKRSEASRNSKGQGKSTEWSVDDISMFKPERWLKEGKFDAQAGPNLAFSTGIRGCYGRKLAYLEMRTCLILVISRFILESCPEDLASFDAADGITHKPKKCYVRLRRAY